MATTTTSLRSRLLILPPSPSSPGAASLRPRPPAATLLLSSRRLSPRLVARAAPPAAPVAAATEEDKEKGPGEGLSPADAERLCEFLRADLPHLFDDVGIDRTAYDDRVKFRDPITRHDTVDGYLFNIRLLKDLFRPDFYLHSVKQTGPYELTTRWTMVMKFMLLPWKPELIFTGLSIMGINPQNVKFNSHVVGILSCQETNGFLFSEYAR